ncbi:MAG: methyl-accepting chemotaxis protein [Magnetospirillum sp. WYHS-4]
MDTMPIDNETETVGSDGGNLIAEGWVPPSRIAELEATIAMIGEGRLLDVPKGTCRLSEALRKLAGTLGREYSRTLKRMVSLSTETNDGVVAAVEMLRGVRQAATRSQTIAAAAEELVASVHEIATNSNAVAKEAGEVQGAIRGGLAAAHRAVENMSDVSQAVDVAGARVHKLAEASADIGKILGMIEEIAFQTDILALNASVEAARAGDAGKGFAVVANEVKRLAGQTKEATVEISRRVHDLRTEMDGIVRSMGEVRSVVIQGRQAIDETSGSMTAVSGRADQVADRMHDVAAILEQQQAAVSEVAQGIGVIADMTDHTEGQIRNTLDTLDRSGAKITEQLDQLATCALPRKLIHLAKSDHVLWKKRIASMLAGRLKLKSEELADHHQCRFGKWYDHVTEPEMREHPAFRAMIAPHEAVHAHGKRAVEMFNSGDLDGAVAELHEVETSSAEVLRLLNELAP